MAGDVIWLDVLPSMAAFGSKLADGARKEGEKAGKESGAAFGKAFQREDSGQQAVVDKLKRTADQAQKVVDRETQGIAKARATQREATAKVIEAEAKLEQARASGDSAKIAAAEERLAAARERADGATAGVEAAEKRLSAATDVRNDAVKDLTVAEKKLTEETDKSKDSAEKSGTAFGKLKDKLVDATGGADGFRDSMKQAGQWFGDNLNKMAMVTGGASVAVGTAFYKIGETFDDVADTIRIGTGAAGEDLEDLVNVAKNIGRGIPVEFEKIGPAVADLNTRFGMTGDTLETVATQYLEASRILGEDVDIQATSKAFSAFKLEGDDVIDAMDALFQVSQATGMGMNDLAKITADSAPAMTNLGFSFHETAALAGQLDKAGMDSNKTMKGLSKGLVELAKDGEKPQEAFRRVVGELDGFIEKGDTAGALNLAKKVFGTRGAAQFVGAIQSGTMNLEDLVDQIEASEDSIIGLAQETDDFAEGWQVVKNNALLALEPLGSAAFDALGSALQDIIPDLQMFGFWVEEHQGLVGFLAGGLGVLAGALGIAAAAQWVMNSALLANPITWIIVGVVALIAAVVLLVKNWDKVVAFLGDVFGPALDWAGQLFSDIGDWMGETWDKIMGFFRSAGDWIGNTWSKSWGAVTGFLKDPVGAGLGLIDGMLGTDLRSKFDGAKSWVSGTWKRSWSTVKNVMKDPVGEGKKLIEGLLGETGLQQVFSKAVTAIAKIWGTIKDKIKAPVKWVGDKVLNPLASGIEKTAKMFGLSWSLPRFSFAMGGTVPKAGAGAMQAYADGGMMPGYTPGRDVHRFYSPTGGLLELSGGEPVLRPEAGAVLGSGWVDGINAAARSGGQAGVRQFLHSQGFAPGGFYVHPNAHRFATGGIVPNATQGFRGYHPPALAAMKAWAAATGRMWHMTGLGGARSRQQQAILYARYKAGKGPLAASPYGNGPHLMPAIAMDLSPRPGENPAARALLPRFGLGLTVRGEPWHVGYLKGRSGGGGMTGDGGFDVLGLLKDAVGKFAKVSGAGDWGTLLNAIPTKLLDEAGKALKKKLLFDEGGVLDPGATVAVNRTGRPEAVLTGSQWDKVARAADSGGGDVNVTLNVDVREVEELMRLLQAARRAGRDVRAVVPGVRS